MGTNCCSSQQNNTMPDGRNTKVLDPSDAKAIAKRKHDQKIRK
jgi:hypothetical protein